MTRKEALAELIEKVEAGENPLEISYVVAEATRGVGSYVHIVHAFHGSLDAAKALHEAVLPGWHYSIDGMTKDGCEAEVFTPPEPAPKPWHCATIIRHQHDAVLNMHNPARAWLLAILRALYAQEPDT